MALHNCPLMIRKCHRVTWAALVALMAVAVAGAVGVTATPALADERSPIPDSRPSWASQSQRIDNVQPGQKITFRVYLQTRDQSKAEALARSISTPGDPAYRQYLTPGQIKAGFAPKSDTVATVRSWLTSSGLTVDAVAENNAYVEAVGTTEQVERTFQVDLGMYRVRNRVLRAADRELSVPSRVRSLVSGVIGVDNSLALVQPQATPAGIHTSGPCAGYFKAAMDTTDPGFGELPAPLPYTVCGYQPTQLRDAYGLSNLTRVGYDGRGVTVAVVSAFASPTLYQDAAEYARRNDPGHPLRPEQFHQIVLPEDSAAADPDHCDAPSWYSEHALDVEAVHAMAPGANILFVGGGNCDAVALDKALNEVVSRNLAQIVTNSYTSAGEDVPESTVRQFQTIAVQAAMQGIGVYFASGDTGDNVAAHGKASPNFPASSPWVTAVGGTTVGIDAGGRRSVETGWETSRSALGADRTWTPAAPGAFTTGSGGGTSTLFRQPWYQRGVVPEPMATRNQQAGQRGRTVPDIAMLGDPNTGMLVGVTQDFAGTVRYDEFRSGGTSLAAPLMAGFVAVADQLAMTRHGFVNPMLYQVANRTGAVRDVQHVDGAVVRVDFVNRVDATGGTRTSVRGFDYQGLQIATGKGYDMVTGLGTPADGRLLLFL